MTAAQLFAILENAKSEESKAFGLYIANSSIQTMAVWNNARRKLYDAFLAYSVATNSALG